MTNEPQRKMDTYNPEDMAIPTWTLLQHTGGNWAKGLGGKPGQFHNSGSDVIADELNLIVVDILMGRARWGDELSDAGPLCTSLDAKSNLSQSGDDCTKCPYRLDTPWTTEASERRTKCCLNYTILGIDISDHMPCIIRAHGISALPVRQLISQLRLNRQLKGEYFRAIISIKSQEKTGRAGTAYALHPKIMELITDETRAGELKAESNRLLGTPIPLPEGRPEEEILPLGFTDQGIPFYTEAERDRLLAAPVQQPEPTPEPEPEPVPAAETITTPPAPPTSEPAPPAAPPAAAKETGEEKETTEPQKEPKKLDLDF